MRRRSSAVLAVPVAAALAVAVAGCGGGGLSLKGDSTDAKAAARAVADSLKPTRPGLRAVACGPLDFELTYRCTVDLGKQAEGTAGTFAAPEG